ncbi:diphthine--ammonia ligase [Galbibacter sp. PAP.153]|uniref:Dph6-related ATP pyrophosphatase n=1 Tax=Galbibacter sp. PAP.153 TaxID=3104623 RepID=UPI00300B0F10
MAHKTYFNWSTGKDSALALYKMNSDPRFSIDALVTTVNTELNRVSMHGLRNELLVEQAKQIGLPLQTIELPGEVSMEGYNAIMKDFMKSIKAQGYTHTVFGDIFLEDLKAFRETKLKEVGIDAEFPLWKQDTKKLINQFIAHGYKAITVSVNAKLLNKSFVGRIIDEDFLKDLPENVDPCGENGEFHTFVFDGPIFKQPVDFEKGEKVLKEFKINGNKDECFKDAVNWDTAFWYCDLYKK